MKPRRPQQHPGCPAWILEGIRQKRDEATGKNKTQPTDKEPHK